MYDPANYSPDYLNRVKRLRFGGHRTVRQTRQTITFESGKLVTYEEVTGSQQGVTAVKATTEIKPDGRMHLKAHYLKKGEWVDGHEITYEESPGAAVLFK